MAFHKPFWGTQPEQPFPPYGSTVKRAPQRRAIAITATASELTGPSSAALLGTHAKHDLTSGHAGEPLGERIYVGGRVLDENGRPVANTLVEVWQCNSAGRYLHAGDRHDAPLDPNFTGEGRVLTDRDGRYRFKTIRPGAYPWKNHHNAWRPAHIHFSLLGLSFGTRLVTQMYFPGDPLLEFDPIYQSIPDVKARQKLVSSLDWEHAQPEYALGYRFDLCIRGQLGTPWEQGR
ncbi:MAG: hypothetical protein RLZZ450_978 [Pseudomonadota bacterium]|jgi:protocatechuate 3,4-dioxygenase beta subunit